MKISILPALNQPALKIVSLLAEFFYTNKRLDLPGIGSFIMEENADTSEPAKGTISFVSNTGLKDSPELVNYIATGSGKIKALAAADLDSHLELARQFLNIGKPFLFEGIGTLTRLQNGQYQFTPGTPAPEKATITTRQDLDTSTGEEHTAGFKSIFYNKKVKTGWKKIVIILLLLSGLALAIWAGYEVYKRSVADKNEQGNIETNRTESKQPDNIKTADTFPDTIGVKEISTHVAPGYYKFIVETAGKERGLKRYSLLKGFGLDIKMETGDSVLFKIYFLLPASPADTTRLIDSLKRLYTPPGIKAFVEK